MKQLKSKNINFYSRLLQSEDKKKGKKKSLKTIIIIYGASVAAAMILLFAGALTMRSKAETAFNDIKYEYENSDLVIKVKEDNALANSNKAFSKIIASYDENNEAVKNAESINKKLTPDLIDKIYSSLTANMQIVGIVFDEDHLNISCMADFPEISTEYVKRLEKTGLFNSVDFGGFVEQGSVYVFTLTAEFPDDDQEVENNG